MLHVLKASWLKGRRTSCVSTQPTNISALNQMPYGRLPKFAPGWMMEPMKTGEISFCLGWERSAQFLRVCDLAFIASLVLVQGRWNGRPALLQDNALHIDMIFLKISRYWSAHPDYQQLSFLPWLLQKLLNHFSTLPETPHVPVKQHCVLPDHLRSLSNHFSCQQTRICDPETEKSLTSTTAATHPRTSLILEGILAHFMDGAVARFFHSTAWLPIPMQIPKLWTGTRSSSGHVSSFVMTVALPACNERLLAVSASGHFSKYAR